MKCIVGLQVARHRSEGAEVPAKLREQWEAADAAGLAMVRGLVGLDDGWGLALDASGQVFATKPTGDVLPRCRKHRVEDGDSIEGRNRECGIDIDPTTCIPNWYGDPLDLDLISDGLLYLDHRLT